jgi:hypothetical protein
MAAPLITGYKRLIDNATGDEIESYKMINYRSHFNFGKINGVMGGESSVIIEFDIWNNEPSFDGYMTATTVPDAINCSFTAWDNQLANSKVNIKDSSTGVSYIRARCLNVPRSNFEEILGDKKLENDNFLGSIKNSPGILSGQPGGDHSIIQTKIVLPLNTSPSIKEFVFAFSYDYV